MNRLSPTFPALMLIVGTACAGPTPPVTLATAEQPPPTQGAAESTGEPAPVATPTPSPKSDAPPPSDTTATWVIELGRLDANLPENAAAATAALWLHEPRGPVLAGTELEEVLEPAALRTLRACPDAACVAAAAGPRAAAVVLLRREARNLILERFAPKNHLDAQRATVPFSAPSPSAEVGEPVWSALRSALEQTFTAAELHSVGSMPRTNAVAVVDRYKREVRTCYGLAMREADAEQARVHLALRVQPDGSVGRTLVASTSLDDPLAARCVRLASRRWRFSPPVGGAEVLHISLELRRRPRSGS